jgi:acetate kinase
LEWAGLKLHEKRNQGTVGSEGQISTDDSRLHAFVIPTDEELLIARDTVRCVLGQQDASQFEHSSKTIGLRS